MNQFIRDLFYSDIPRHKGATQAPRYQKALQTIAEKEDLVSGLAEADRSAFLALINAYDTVLGVQTEEAFVEGFQLGAKMMMEVLEEDDGTE